MEVNQFAEYKRAWLTQVTNLTSKIVVIKERITEVLFSFLRKNKHDGLLPNTNDSPSPI